MIFYKGWQLKLGPPEADSKNRLGIYHEGAKGSGYGRIRFSG